MSSVAAKRVSALVWGVITDFSWQVLEFRESPGPSWMHCFFEVYPKIFRHFWETFSSELKICSYKWWFSCCQNMLKIAEPIIPSFCERIFISIQQKFSPENQILACCWLWKNPRAPERSPFWRRNAAQRCRLYKKRGARCCPNVLTCLNFLQKSFLTLTWKVNIYFPLLLTVFVS